MMSAEHRTQRRWAVAVWTLVCLSPALLGAHVAHQRPAVITEVTPPPADVPEGVIDHPCLGRWLGWGRNTWSSEPWSIDMTVTRVEGEGCGSIEYPSLRCGGFLETCSMRTNILVFRELYTHNPGTCAPAGLIEAYCVGDTMTWRWFGSNVEVDTELRRVPTK